MLTRWSIVTLLALHLLGCEGDSLSRELARLRVTPLPAEGGLQTALTDPTGMDLGEVPLGGLGIARFRLDNVGRARLVITSAELSDASGGVFAVESVTEEVTALNTELDAGELVVSFAPAADGGVGSAVVRLHTNGGDSGDEVVEVQLHGVGKFVGHPNIEICYGETCYPRPEDCAPGTGGLLTCTLPTFAWGNVPLGSTATQQLRVRNAPAAGTCTPPPGSPKCTPVCRLVFDENPAGRNLGFGFLPADEGFNVAGNVALPFSLDVANPQCGFVSDVRLLLQFTAGTDEADHASVLYIESNDPDAPIIEIPVTAQARKAPVAVAEPVPCTLDTLPNCVPNIDAVRPLDRIFLTGENSFDPNGGTITAYEWSVEEVPPGTTAEEVWSCTGDADCMGGACQCLDQACACVPNPAQPVTSLWLPLAGRYVVRLKVRNDLGIQSGVTESSDLEILAVPDSRLHIQLVWDHPTNDQDLHVTSVTAGDHVCGAPEDCFWGNCKPECADPDAECRALPQWFSASPVFEGPNPHLDIDDTNGLGPENVNIDEPGVDRYRVYVHYYTLVDRSEDPTQATVRIYIDGQLAAEYRRLLQPDDLWRVAQIEWFADGVSTVTGATNDANGQGSVKTLLNCSTPFAFGEPL